MEGATLVVYELGVEGIYGGYILGTNVLNNE